jgi:hypothetical protein
VQYNAVRITILVKDEIAARGSANKDSGNETSCSTFYATSLLEGASRVPASEEIGNWKASAIAIGRVSQAATQQLAFALASTCSSAYLVAPLSTVPWAPITFCRRDRFRILDHLPGIREGDGLPVDALIPVGWTAIVHLPSPLPFLGDRRFSSLLQRFCARVRKCTEAQAHTHTQRDIQGTSFWRAMEICADYQMRYARPFSS